MLFGGFLELGSLHWGLATTFQGELGVKINIQESNFELRWCSNLI
ncbi:hypothetical protein E1A91_D03G081300v1 [Gossypium mustelinum]|uniref:Uncharacterized protein n=1 Tax=Gossypium mustelinum TaxID=34275 RepID=A0A5D2VKK3_GOSMU|nr:hypothetical protein E1A91_D03G081300v1 [Gossypium mustelinum]